MLAGKFGGFDLAFCAALAKPAWHQDRVEALQMRRHILAFENFRIDPLNLHAHAIGHAAMGKGFRDRFIGIFQLRIFSHNRNSHRTFGVVNPIGHVFPTREIRLWSRSNLKRVKHRLIQAFAVIGQRGLIDRF